MGAPPLQVKGMQAAGSKLGRLQSCKGGLAQRIWQKALGKTTLGARFKVLHPSAETLFPLKNLARLARLNWWRE